MSSVWSKEPSLISFVYQPAIVQVEALHGDIELLQQELEAAQEEARSAKAAGASKKVGQWLGSCLVM